MPRFVPVYDPEKPRSERDLGDSNLLAHRKWENPHSLSAREALNSKKSSLKEKGNEKAYEEPSLYAKRSSNPNLCKNEFGLWKKKEANRGRNSSTNTSSQLLPDRAGKAPTERSSNRSLDIENEEEGESSRVHDKHTKYRSFPPHRRERNSEDSSKFHYRKSEKRRLSPFTSSQQDKEEEEGEDILREKKKREMAGGDVVRECMKPSVLVGRDDSSIGSKGHIRGSERRGGNGGGGDTKFMEGRVGGDKRGEAGIQVVNEGVGGGERRARLKERAEFLEKTSSHENGWRLERVIELKERRGLADDYTHSRERVAREASRHQEKEEGGEEEAERKAYGQGLGRHREASRHRRFGEQDRIEDEEGGFDENLVEKKRKKDEKSVASEEEVKSHIRSSLRGDIEEEIGGTSLRSKNEEEESYAPEKKVRSAFSLEKEEARLEKEEDKRRMLDEKEEEVEDEANKFFKKKRLDGRNRFSEHEAAKEVSNEEKVISTVCSKKKGEDDELRGADDELMREDDEMMPKKMEKEVGAMLKKIGIKNPPEGSSFVRQGKGVEGSESSQKAFRRSESGGSLNNTEEAMDNDIIPSSTQEEYDDGGSLHQNESRTHESLKQARRQSFSHSSFDARTRSKQGPDIKAAEEAVETSLIEETAHLHTAPDEVVLHTQRYAHQSDGRAYWHENYTKPYQKDRFDNEVDRQNHTYENDEVIFSSRLEDQQVYSNSQQRSCSTSLKDEREIDTTSYQRLEKYQEASEREREPLSEKNKRDKRGDEDVKRVTRDEILEDDKIGRSRSSHTKRMPRDRSSPPPSIRGSHQAPFHGDSRRHHEEDFRRRSDVLAYPRASQGYPSSRQRDEKHTCNLTNLRGRRLGSRRGTHGGDEPAHTRVRSEHRSGRLSGAAECGAGSELNVCVDRRSSKLDNERVGGRPTDQLEFGDNKASDSRRRSFDRSRRLSLDEERRRTSSPYLQMRKHGASSLKRRESPPDEEQSREMDRVSSLERHTNDSDKLKSDSVCVGADKHASLEVNAPSSSFRGKQRLSSEEERISASFSHRSPKLGHQFSLSEEEENFKSSKASRNHTSATSDAHGEEIAKPPSRAGNEGREDNVGDSPPSTFSPEGEINHRNSRGGRRHTHYSGGGGGGGSSHTHYPREGRESSHARYSRWTPNHDTRTKLSSHHTHARGHTRYPPPPLIIFPHTSLSPSSGRRLDKKRVYDHSSSRRSRSPVGFMGSSHRNRIPSSHTPSRGGEDIQLHAHGRRVEMGGEREGFGGRSSYFSGGRKGKPFASMHSSRRGFATGSSLRHSDRRKRSEGDEAFPPMWKERRFSHEEEAYKRRNGHTHTRHREAEISEGVASTYWPSTNPEKRRKRKRSTSIETSTRKLHTHAQHEEGDEEGDARENDKLAASEEARDETGRKRRKGRLEEEHQQQYSEAKYCTVSEREFSPSKPRKTASSSSSIPRKSQYFRKKSSNLRPLESPSRESARKMKEKYSEDEATDVGKEREDDDEEVRSSEDEEVRTSEDGDNGKNNKFRGKNEVSSKKQSSICLEIREDVRRDDASNKEANHLPETEEEKSYLELKKKRADEVSMMKSLGFPIDFA